MTCSLGVSGAETNAKLLIKMMRELDAADIGSISNFFEVSTQWRCPCCHRSKEEIVRLDKNRNLLCAIHWHHDHFENQVGDQIGRGSHNISDSFVRFPPTLICSDCNVAEGTVAKPSAGAFRDFSFAPYEIASFIIVRKNLPHSVDVERAQQAYEAAKPSMALITQRLRAVVKSSRAEDDTFEHVGGAAWRALKEIRLKMKDAG